MSTLVCQRRGAVVYIMQGMPAELLLSIQLELAIAPAMLQLNGKCHGRLKGEVPGPRDGWAWHRRRD